VPLSVTGLMLLAGWSTGVWIRCGAVSLAFHECEGLCEGLASQGLAGGESLEAVLVGGGVVGVSVGREVV